MKKSICLIAVLSVLLLTGCSNEKKMTCSKELEYDGAKLSTKFITTYKDEYATKTEEKIVADCDKEDFAKSFAKQYEGKEGYTVKVDGNKVTINHKATISEQNKKLEENKIKQIKSYYENQGYTCDK